MRWKWRSGTAITWGRRIDGLVHHSDRGVQYLAVRSTQRLSEAGMVASVGTTGDSYDNAPAEAFHSLFNNHRRLHSQIGLVPPPEFEEAFHRHEPGPIEGHTLVQSLR